MSHSELMSRLSIVTMVSTLQRIILSQIVDSQMYMMVYYAMVSILLLQVGTMVYFYLLYM